MSSSLLLDALALARGPIEEARAWIGRVEPPAPAARSIGVSQVELFASLVRDDDPRYWAPIDPREVPPALLLSYSLPLPWRPPSITAAPIPIWARIPLPGDTLINVSTSTTFYRTLRTDDVVSISEEVVDISAEKKTRLGTGHFLTTRARYQVGDRPLADHVNVMFRYHQGTAAQRRPGPPPAPRVGADVSFDVTAELCVHNVAATGDFFPGHYDAAYARSQGVPDAYLNTMFFQGLADQLARRRRPGRRLTRRDLTMLAPAFVGGTITAGAHDTGSPSDPVEVEVHADHGPCARATIWFGEPDGD